MNKFPIVLKKAEEKPRNFLISFIISFSPFFIKNVNEDANVT